MSDVQDTVTQVKRYACDRCHGQKLRCPRLDNGGNPNGPCTRCQRAGQVCTISSALKTGRPRKGSKRQAHTDRQPSPGSSPLSRASSNSRLDAPVSRVSSNKVSKSRRNEGRYQSQDAESTTPSHASLTSAIAGPFQTRGDNCGENASPMIMEAYAKYLDLEVDNSKGTDLGRFDTTGEQDICKPKFRDCQAQSGCQALTP